jgi:predicted Zn-dependent peptidase
MRKSQSTRVSRAAIGGLVGLAIVATTFVAGTGSAQAQVKHWDKIKYPELRDFKVPEPEKFVMPNGITVLLIEDHELPLIEVDVRVRTGSRLEPAAMAGLAEVMGDVMRTGGAGGRSGDELDEYLEGLGARIDTSMQTAEFRADMSCLKDDFGGVVKALSDVLRTPAFEQKKIDVTKNQAKAGIARRNDDPTGIMFREANKLVYGADSPYSTDTEYATLDAFDRNDIKAFHAKYFIPNRTWIGILGDFKSAEMKKTLEAVFGDWKKGPEFKDDLPPVQMASKGGIYYIEKDDVTQSNIWMGHLGIQRNDPDFYASQVMNQVLSGSFAARLFNNIRTVKGLAYRVRGNMGANYDYPGTFTMFMSTKTETTAASIDALLVEVDALLAAPPTADEMMRAREGLLNSFIFNFDTKEEVLSQQLTLAYYGYPSDFIAKFKDNIERVTAEQIHKLAQKHIHKDQLAILVVGKSEGLDRPLASFGDVRELDITITEPEASGKAIAAAPGMSMEQAAEKGSMILNKMLMTAGGAEKIDAVKSINVNAGVTVVTPGGEFQLGANQITVLPDRMRMELNTPMGRQVQVVTPADAFSESPQGAQPMSDSQKSDSLKSLRRELITVLQARKDSGQKVIFTGTGEVEGVACEMIAVMLEDDNIRFAVDAATGRVMQASYQGKSMQGIPGEIVATYSDFRNVDGVELPFVRKQTHNGDPMMTLEIKEMVINGQIDEAGFKMPAAAAAAGAPSGAK